MSKAAATAMNEASLQSLGESELRLELDARIAEAAWLNDHYDRLLREAYGRIETLEGELQAVQRGVDGAAGEGALADYDRLRLECARLTAAEQRYLERIEELKGAPGSE